MFCRKSIWPDIKLLPDGTHPNAAGYTVWADALLPYLKEICGTK